MRIRFQVRGYIGVHDSKLEIILKLAQLGDNDAFSDLQIQFEQSVRRFVLRLIGHHDEVDDIVQRTFIALYMNLDRIEPVAKLRPFLFRVARNLSYDYLRKIYRHEDVSLQDCEYRLSTNASSLEEKAHWSIVFEEVRKVIDCLPIIHRDTLILYIEEGLSQAEIAETMNTEIGTVKSRLFYARKLLKQTVSPDILSMLKDRE